MASLNKRRRWHRFFQFRHIWVRLVCGLFIAAFLLFFLILYYYQQQAASYDLSIMDKPIGTSKLYAADDQELGLVGEHTYLLATREELPQHLINALVAREDNDFFEHEGVDYYAFGRATYQNIRNLRYKQGGSTISMQLARNLFELRSRSIDRKLLEIAIAIRLEESFSKDAILVQYLNRIYYGRHSYGIANAARLYFGKRVKDLNLVECATLVGLIRGPAIFNPIADMKAAVQVKNETLDAMRRLDFITEEELEKAKNAPIIIKQVAGPLPAASYPLMAIEAALKELQTDVLYDTADMGIRSYFSKEIQHYVERSSEECMQFLEGSRRIPEDWLRILAQDNTQSKEEIAQGLLKLKALPDFPSRRKGAEDSLLQCAVLVVDARRNKKGQVQALTAGRSTWDGRNKWKEEMLLGDLASPFIYTIACQAEMSEHSIIANNPALTGERLGYTRVSDYLQDLDLYKGDIPEAEAAKLYQGLYRAPRLMVARRLYSLLHQGVDFPFRFIEGIFSRNRAQVYSVKDRELPEIIRREATHIVKQLLPFQAPDNKPLKLNITLPENEGQWCMLSREHSVTVFVWMGFDHPRPSAASEQLMKLRLAYIAPLLTEQIFQYAEQQHDKEKKK